MLKKTMIQYNLTLYAQIYSVNTEKNVKFYGLTPGVSGSKPWMITIGNVIIGAGSIVTKDIPDNSVAAGVPDKVIKSLDEYEEKVIEECLGFGDLSFSKKAESIKNTMVLDKQ